MMRRGSPVQILLFALALAASSSSAGMLHADEEILLRVAAGVEEVELGKAFPLTVVRRWNKALEPDAWSDRQLAPLTVKRMETTRREDDQHVEETRHYLCYAFSLEKITVPAFVFKARPGDGGPERIATCDGFTLRVIPILDPATPGPAELPGGLLLEPEPSTWLLWPGGVCILAAVSLAWFLIIRARRAEMLHAAPHVAPYQRAMQRLERLRGLLPDTAEEIDAYYVEASMLLREYIGERFALHAPKMTTEEFLSAPQTGRAVHASHHELLNRFLSCCDRVKFARHTPAAPDHENLLDEAARFLEETRKHAARHTGTAVSPEGSSAA